VPLLFLLPGKRKKKGGKDYSAVLNRKKKSTGCCGLARRCGAGGKAARATIIPSPGKKEKKGRERGQEKTNIERPDLI
jgi:hypothetical protein